jgi:2-keto-3-deoxy-6-phosphogluconate aldolase
VKIFPAEIGVAGVGSNLVNAKVLATKDWTALTEMSARYVHAMKVARQG